MVIVLLRYAHVIEKHQNCVLNTASLSTGWICAAGLIMVGNFQVHDSLLLYECLCSQWCTQELSPGTSVWAWQLEEALFSYIHIGFLQKCLGIGLANRKTADNPAWMTRLEWLSEIAERLCACLFVFEGVWLCAFCMYTVRNISGEHPCRSCFGYSQLLFSAGSSFGVFR